MLQIWERVLSQRLPSGSAFRICYRPLLTISLILDWINYLPLSLSVLLLLSSLLQNTFLQSQLNMCIQSLIYVILVVPCVLLLCRVPQIKYYVKFIAFLGFISLGSVYYIFVFMFGGQNYLNAWWVSVSILCYVLQSRRFKRVFYLAGKLIGLRPVVIDREHFISNKPCIYVANHQSCIDVASKKRPAVFYSFFLF